jgi:hypothetical protein
VSPFQESDTWSNESQATEKLKRVKWKKAFLDCFEVTVLITEKEEQETTLCILCGRSYFCDTGNERKA